MRKRTILGEFVIIIVGMVIYFALVNAILNEVVNGEEKETSFISCDNPAGCVGKFPKGVDWPVCPICNTPISSVVNVSENGNISEEIVSLFEKAVYLQKEIEKIKERRRFEEEERIKNLKAYGIAHAKNVRDNMQVLADAYARTKTFLERGGEEVPDSVIVGFIGAKPVWKKEEDFLVYPRPR